ncbi:hypothetical protein RND81_02G022500 [Saponaria officinalis]|uniref:Uncharacterized protein n=1 Tax=Saponaria officinalis TaxID=3572 RepID=A0AAW1MR37_SAPOF
MNSKFVLHTFTGDSSPATEVEVESSISDCESGTSYSVEQSARRNRRRVFGEDVAVELTENERSNELIRRRFLAGVGDTADVVAVHRRNWSENTFGQARVQAFQVHANALVRKHGTPPNVKFCWYGGDKHAIREILNCGFSFRDLKLNNNGAVVLSPDNSPSQSVEDSSEDEDGLRHVLLCRVLIGRSELVNLESNQCGPCSDEFDSGVDSYDNPKKYLIWSTHMNTHILPEFVVTFKSKSPQSSPKGVCGTSDNAVKMPTSPWITFPALISILARILPQDAVSLINKFHKEYKVCLTSNYKLNYD